MHEENEVAQILIIKRIESKILEDFTTNIKQIVQV